VDFIVYKKSEILVIHQNQ